MSTVTQRHAVCCELVHDVARNAGSVRLRVVGASMMPTIWLGDVLTVRRCDLAQLRPGQVALYHRAGKLTAHRILKLFGDGLIARGDSVPTLDPPVQAREIVGQVVSISRAGRSVSPMLTFWQRATSCILRRSDLLMRITLYLSRRLRPSWDMRSTWTNSSPLSIKE